MTFQRRPCPQWQAPHQGSWCLRLVRLRPSCTCTKTFGILSRKLTCCWHNRGTHPSWLTPSECNQPVQPPPEGTVSYYLLSRLLMHLGFIESDMEKSADRVNFRRFTLILKTFLHVFCTDFSASKSVSMHVWIEIGGRGWGGGALHLVGGHQSLHGVRSPG